MIVFHLLRTFYRIKVKSKHHPSYFPVLINWSHLEPLFYLCDLSVQGILISCTTVITVMSNSSFCVSCNWVQPNNLLCAWRCRQCYSQCVCDEWNNFTRCHHNLVNTIWWHSYRWDHSSQMYCIHHTRYMCYKLFCILFLQLGVTTHLWPLTSHSMVQMEPYLRQWLYPFLMIFFLRALKFSTWLWQQITPLLYYYKTPMSHYIYNQT